MPTTRVVFGDDLYHVAARELGDATQWIRIAQANNIVDPIITQLTTLTIPDVDPTLTGGTPEQ